MRSFAILVLAGMAALTANPAFAASISIAAGGIAGTYYPIGVAIAAAITKTTDMQATAETGNAAVANTDLVADGKVEAAFSQADVTAWAYNGQLMFRGKPLKNIRAIAALYPETLQLVISKQSGIKTVADLKGKSVGVGAPGSGTEGDARTIFDTVGLKYEDVKVDFIDFSAISNRFRDDQIDAGFVVAGVPTLALMNLTAAKDVMILNFDEDTMGTLVKANPFFIPHIIPAGTYRGIDTDVATPAVMALLITSDSVPEEVIYNLTKGIFENIDEVRKSHAMAENIKLETATTGLTAPLHPGAAKYYREKGIKVD